MCISKAKSSHFTYGVRTVRLSLYGDRISVRLILSLTILQCWRCWRGWQCCPCATTVQAVHAIHVHHDTDASPRSRIYRVLHLELDCKRGGCDSAVIGPADVICFRGSCGGAVEWRAGELWSGELWSGGGIESCRAVVQ